VRGHVAGDLGARGPERLRVDERHEPALVAERDELHDLACLRTDQRLSRRGDDAVAPHAPENAHVVAQRLVLVEFQGRHGLVFAVGRDRFAPRRCLTSECRARTAELRKSFHRRVTRPCLHQDRVKTT